MSEKISIKNEGGEGEYKVPDEVYNANWRDDIPDLEGNDNAIKFELLTDNSDLSEELDESDYDYNTSATANKIGRQESVRIQDFHHKIGIKAIKAINLMKKAA